MSIKKDWLRMAEHDPSILEWRRCTGDDVRRLAALAGLSKKRARIVFGLCLFGRTRYLTRQLDPAFEPEEKLRVRAKLILEKKKLVREQRENPQAVEAVVQKPALNGPPSRLSRYRFN